MADEAANIGRFNFQTFVGFWLVLCLATFVTLRILFDIGLWASFKLVAHVANKQAMKVNIPWQL